MNPKTLIYIGITVLGTVGGWLGSMLDSDAFGGWAILGSLIGGLLGIWVGYKLSR